VTFTPRTAVAVSVLDLDVDGLLGAPVDVVTASFPLRGHNDPTGGEFTFRPCSTRNQMRPIMPPIARAYPPSMPRRARSADDGIRDAALE
jgi:hypothetical protein